MLAADGGEEACELLWRQDVKHLDLLANGVADKLLASTQRIFVDDEVDLVLKVWQLLPFVVDQASLGFLHVVRVADVEHEEHVVGGESGALPVAGSEDGPHQHLSRGARLSCALSLSLSLSRLVSVTLFCCLSPP